MKHLIYPAILFASFLLWSGCEKKTNTITAVYREITEAVYASGNLYT